MNEVGSVNKKVSQLKSIRVQKTKHKIIAFWDAAQRTPVEVDRRLTGPRSLLH
jgi:hypothetical protein